jgi:hypothetical protein
MWWWTHARLFPCLWCGPKGVLWICGDSGDSGNETQREVLLESLKADCQVRAGR